MVMEHQVRFPEHHMRIEDAMFGFKCYTVAGRVSLLADYDYYILQDREDGSNISRKGLDPTGYTRDTMEVAAIIQNGVPAGELRDRIIAELYRRLCLRRYVGKSFANASEKRQNAWIRGHQEFVAAFVPPALDSYLEPANRQRSALIRAGRRDDLVVMAASTSGDALVAEMHAVEPRESGCTVVGNVRLQHQFREFDWAVLELKRRGHKEQISFNVYPDSLNVPEGQPSELPRQMEFRVEISHDALKHYPHGVYDVSLRTALDGKSLSSRVTALSGDATVQYPGTEAVHFYATRHGNLTCRF
jgi:hypothetical protein